jgi:Xaa-Pro aminopeptidase
VAAWSCRLGARGNKSCPIQASCSCTSLCRGTHWSLSLTYMRPLRAFFRSRASLWGEPYVVARSRSFHQSPPSFNIADMETVNTTERLGKLRELMKQKQLDVYSTTAIGGIRTILADTANSRPVRRQPPIRVHCTLRCPPKYRYSPDCLDLPTCSLRTAYISGFSGSAGTAVVTHEKAALATDGRYFNQAEKQLDPNWELLKQGLTDVPTWQDWYE